MKHIAATYFCGARAYFGGLYLRPPAGCAPAEVAATRKRFKLLYDQRKHAEAAAQLDSLLPRCERVIMDIVPRLDRERSGDHATQAWG